MPPDPNKYSLLSELPPDSPLPTEPVRLWLVLTLEIVIDVDGAGALEDGRRYLLLIQRNYGAGRSGSFEGYWAPPSRAYPVELGYRVPQTVGTLKERFDEREAELDLKRDAEQLGYSLGLRDPEYSCVGEITESKASRGNPDQHCCYRIVRYRVRERNDNALCNLADPDGRKGHVFLPLDNLEQVLTNGAAGAPAVASTGDGHGPKELVVRPGDEWSFQSKPLVSNVVYLLSEHSRIAQLGASSTTLRPGHFVRKECGLVIDFDLAGYGAALKYVKEEMRSIDQQGLDIAAQLRDSTASFFNEFLASNGISQIHLAGDGFIAGLPERTHGSPDEALSNLFRHYGPLIDLVESLNEHIDTPEHEMGSRLAIHWGDYRFGRVGLARNLVVGFDGPTIIDVARMEAGLREMTKGTVTSQLGGMRPTEIESPRVAPLEEWPHTIFVSDSARGQAAAFFQNPRPELKVLDKSVTIGVKEAELSGQVIGFGSGPTVESPHGSQR